MWFSLLLIAFGILFFYLKKRYSYWRDRGVPGPDPVYLFGNVGGAFIGKRSISDIYCEIYREYEGYPFVGIYRMLTPVLIIRDPELVKNVMVKDFKSFSANDFDIDRNIDRLFGRNPFVLTGMEWKTRRSQLTSLLTSGKIKATYPMLEEVSKKMVNFIQERCSKGYVTLESKELGVLFTLDNVAAFALGVEGNCFTEENSNFRKLGDEFLSPGKQSSLKSSLVWIFPILGKIFRIKFISTAVEDQLIHMVREILEDRRKNNIVRNDFLDSVAQLCKSSQFNEEIDIVSQIATFFLDAYETSSWVIGFALYTLASHPDCQSKLRKEIDTYSENAGGKMDYDSIQKMPYLQACIDESMRMIPVFRQFVKVCTERYTFTCTDPDFKNLSINIEPETGIVVPVESLQHDAKYFDNPKKYNPERFLDNSNYNKICFLPFGEGQRSCIGMRFGIIQVKLAVAQVIHNFELTVNEKTQTPLEYDKWYFTTCPIGGLWLDFKKIERK